MSTRPAVITVCHLFSTVIPGQISCVLTLLCRFCLLHQFENTHGFVSSSKECWLCTQTRPDMAAELVTMVTGMVKGTQTKAEGMCVGCAEDL